MTSSSIKSTASRAKALASIGNCSGAERLFNQAWGMLNLYAEQQAAAGKSPSGAVSLHRSITTSYNYFRGKCHDSDSLITPSFGPTRANPDLIAPTFAPMRQNPDLMPPSMNGFGASDTEGRDTVFAIVGAVASVGLVAVGFHAAKR